MRVKPDKKGRELIEFVKSLRLGTYDYYDKYPKKSKTAEKLKANGFEFFDNGGFKTVWIHKRFPHYVLKVYQTRDSFERDSHVWPEEYKKLEKHYLYPIYQTKFYQIQHMVEQVFEGEHYQKAGDVDEFVDMFPEDMDVVPKNIGIFKDKLVVIDFIS